MKVTVYTLATDDNDGTTCRIFASETERDNALLEWVQSSREEWAASPCADNLHEYVQSLTDYLDTFSTDEQALEIDGAAQMTINEAWTWCKETPGSFGNLYDPEEVLSILDGWAEEGDESKTSYWFDPESDEDRKAILAWCEKDGADFEDKISDLVCASLPTRGEAFEALVAKNRKAGAA